MAQKLKARLAAVLPSLRALGQWAGLAGLTGAEIGRAHV